MKTRTTLAALTALFAAVTATAQTIYEPTKDVAAQGITLKGWGSGTIAQTDEMAFEGTSSVRVSSRNFFQGGVFKFANGIDLAPATSGKSNLLLFTLHAPVTVAAGGGGGGRQGGGRSGGGDAGGDSGAAGGQLGGASGGQGSTTTQAQIKPLTKIRVVITTSDGKNAEAYIDITSSVKDNNGWFSAGIPLAAIAGFNNTNKKVTAIALSGDSVSTFYVGQVKVLEDNTPVFVEANVSEVNLGFGEEFTFFANGYAGSTAVKYTWDFDAADGISVDAEGPSVTHRFRREGTFTVTVTAVDVFGLKQPRSAKITVTVNP